jgi:GH18 family chitinase
VEILETNSAVRLDIMGVYNLPKKDARNFKVSQYLRMDNTDVIDLADDPAFSGYYDVVTDVIIFETAYIDGNGELAFYGGEKEIGKYFDANIAALKSAIGGRGVRIWATVMFDQYKTASDGGRVKDLDKTAALLNSKRATINASIKNFVEKYGLYGIDYDWEYPQKKSHWDAYGQIISDTAEYTKVSVAISPWNFGAPRKIIEKVEHFNVMCYDLFDGRMHHSTTATAAFSAIGNVVNKLKIPREKILFGIPTYGRATNGSGNSWPTYGETIKLIDGEYEGSLGKWGNKIQNFEYYENGMKKSSAAYLNGYAIVRDKTLFAVYAELGGVMIFRAKCDSGYDYEYSLHRAVKNTLDAFIG